jgi:hypothetical protein
MLSVYTEEPADRKEAYPRPVNLMYSEVKWWQFSGKSADATEVEPVFRSDDPQDYINLLNGFPDGRQQHIYQSIENTLYNWGHFDKADEIHREMRRWLLNERINEAPRFVKGLDKLSSGLWGRVTWVLDNLVGLLKSLPSLLSIVWLAFWDGVTRGLTSPLRLVFVMLVWALFSAHVFSLRENISLSEEGYLTKSDSIRYLIDRPPDEDWGLSEGVWMAFHFHVPVAQFTARDEWEPANDRPLVVGSGVLTSEGYANIVLVLHWIMWPVVIILSTRRLFRRAQQ